MRPDVYELHSHSHQNASESLLEQVIKKGKCLLVNNEKELAKFEMVSLSKILDFSYLRRRMQSGFVKKIMEG